MFISEMLGDGPSITTILVGFLGLGMVGLCLSLLRWWASVPIIIILGLWAIILLDDLFAPDLYPYYSIHPDFLYTATIAIALGMLLPIIGMVTNIVRRFKNINDRPSL